ncbi:MAG TPA: glycosyltransferase [Gammaproteobacteria bacterium]|jgi:glycosyltransferase involved in cell wall biosynthesis|nr:glycosyltransferase [Gammaproteobacteria bacterium]
MNSESVAQQQQQQLPKISVVIPVWNGAATLEKALTSILEQQYANAELIILDAGSTDGTLDIIKRYQAHIAYWHSQRDGSAYAAINIGIEKATGVLIAQLMADDWFEPAAFHAVAKTFQANPSVDIVSCGGRIVTKISHSHGETIKALQTYTTAEALHLTVYNVCYGVPAMSSRFIAKAFFNKIGVITPFDATGKHLFSGDREFLLRAIMHGCKQAVTTHLSHTYVAHPGSATFGNNRANQIKIYREHMMIVERYLSHPQLSTTDRAILQRWYADQSIRLFLYTLVSGNLKAAWLAARAGISKLKFNWFIVLVNEVSKLAIKKIA